MLHEFRCTSEPAPHPSLPVIHLVWRGATLDTICGRDVLGSWSIENAKVWSEDADNVKCTQCQKALHEALDKLGMSIRPKG